MVHEPISYPELSCFLLRMLDENEGTFSSSMRSKKQEGSGYEIVHERGNTRMRAHAHDCTIHDFWQRQKIRKITSWLPVLDKGFSIICPNLRQILKIILPQRYNTGKCAALVSNNQNLTAVAWTNFLVTIGTTPSRQGTGDETDWLTAFWSTWASLWRR